MNLITLLLLTALHGLASPAQGERVLISGFYNGKPVYLDRVNLGQSENQSWIVQTKITFEGQTIVKKVLMPLMTSERMQKLVNECHRFSGINEEITVKAGKFQTCRLQSQSEAATVWAADVPFGVVKKEVKSATTNEIYELEFIKK